MLFSWDESKRRENWEARKVDLLEAALIFDGEQRIQALGQVDGTFYVVAYTWYGDIRHLITAWKVGENGRRRYEAIFARRDQADAGKGSDEDDTG